MKQRPEESNFININQNLQKLITISNFRENMNQNIAFNITFDKEKII